MTAKSCDIGRDRIAHSRYAEKIKEEFPKGRFFADRKVGIGG